MRRLRRCLVNTHCHQLGWRPFDPYEATIGHDTCTEAFSSAPLGRGIYKSLELWRAISGVGTATSAIKIMRTDACREQYRYLYYSWLVCWSTPRSE